jgi:hypothetical protein
MNDFREIDRGELARVAGGVALGVALGTPSPIVSEFEDWYCGNGLRPLPLPYPPVGGPFPPPIVPLASGGLGY